MKNIVLNLCLLLAFSVSLSAQNLSSSKGQSALGAGFGLPYGGLGAKMSVNPTDQFVLFAGAGYNLVGFGSNFGAQYILPSKRRTEFFLTGMYGYNAVIIVEEADFYNVSFNGVTAGLGFRVNSLRNEGAFWDFGLLVPARSKDFKTFWEFINNTFQDTIDPFPVLFYFGYNFPISVRTPKQ
jgi:hypothetical protein